MKPHSPSSVDRSQDVFHLNRHPLDPIFKPESVAVIGASEKSGSVGRSLLTNLLNNPFGGVVFPVNPKRPHVLGIKAYPTILDVPQAVDLAIIATPAATVPGLVDECAKAGVQGIIVISAGFKEAGPEGKALEEQVLAKARQAGIRLIGPNCLGVMLPQRGLNATFAVEMALPGKVAFLSQSGALGTAILDWSLNTQVGLSAFVSVGSMVDVGWGDLIDYFGNDANTSSIVIYMESVGDARAFLSAARETVFNKPIVVIKSGRSGEAAQAAASHTGALAGDDGVLDAAFARCGVLRANTIAEVFDLADILSKQPRPLGNKLTIVTNAGGPGVLATDSLIRWGGQLAALPETTEKALNQVLPAAWSHHNPIDILGDADPDRYAKTLDIVCQDAQTDGLLVILTPQTMSDPTQTAQKLAARSRMQGKPVFASWMGGKRVAEGANLLSAAGIPAFEYPDDAVRTFVDLWRFSYNLKGLYETPLELPEFLNKPPDREKAVQLLKSVRDQKRTLLTEVESKQLLATYGIPIALTVAAPTGAEAVKAAETMGYPVVVKLYSTTITHKTDVGGVKLNLNDAEEVQRAFGEIRKSVTEKAGAEAFQGVVVEPMVRMMGQEIILGSHVDPQFGPVILFGMGGQLVEVLKDVALALPPLNTNLAKRLMEKTKVFKALQGVRGNKPVDQVALEQLLVRFSYLVVEQPWIKEIDVNPILASPDGLLALDARVVLHPLDLPESSLPKPAIRPYPSQYISSFKLKDGTDVTFRPIRPEDEPLVVKYHATLSERTVFLRYFQPLQLSQRTAHERLVRICFTDYEREIALVALHHNAAGEPEVIGICRLSITRRKNEAEYSILISDQWQNQGLGTQMMKAILDIAKREKLKRVNSFILAENHQMQVVCKKLGFQFQKPEPDADYLTAWIDL